MSKKLKIQHKQFVDELFLNGFNREKAYEKFYPGINKKYSGTHAYRLLQRDDVKAYYDSKMKEYRDKLDIDKQGMLDRLVTVYNKYQEMLFLADKDELTKTEESRLNRLQMVLKGSDAAKSMDMIAKIMGSYAAEKQEIHHKVEQPVFGPQPKQIESGDTKGILPDKFQDSPDIKVQYPDNQDNKEI